MADLAFLGGKPQQNLVTLKSVQLDGDNFTMRVGAADNLILIDHDARYKVCNAIIR
jgi:hypothetical protein